MPATKSPQASDGPAIHSLDHIVLSVPDLEVGARFYEAFGLDVRRSPREVELRCFGSDHVWLRLVSVGGPRLHEIVFGGYPELMEAHRAKLEAMKVAGLQSDGQGGLSFRDLQGVRLRIVPAAKCSPDTKAVPSAFHDSSPPGVYACPLRSKAKPVHPRRLSHALFFTGDIDPNLDFYCQALGLRVSDRAGPGAFLHSPHGSEHHLIALAGDRGPGVQHIAWDVGSVHEIGLGMNQMEAAGYGQGGWGLGRHVLGSNYFHYVRDPWGSYAEYSFDMDYIPAGFPWKAGNHKHEDAHSAWAPPLPEGFTTNWQVEQAASLKTA